jgi:hypothetical protein
MIHVAGRALNMTGQFPEPFNYMWSAMKFLCKATHAASPQLGHQHATCFSNVYRQPSVVQCRYLSRTLTAAEASTPHAQVPAGSRARRCPPWRFRTRVQPRVQPRALIESGNVLLLVMRCLLL